MRHDWLDTALFHVERNQSGFIDEARMDRMTRRFNRQYPEADVGHLEWASLAVAAWFASQPVKHTETIAPAVTSAMRGAIEKLGFGNDAAFRNTLWIKAHTELDLTPAIGVHGVISVTGVGVGADIMTGLYAYAAAPERILLCEYCARPFTARIGARTCSAGCRSAITKTAA